MVMEYYLEVTFILLAMMHNKATENEDKSLNSITYYVAKRAHGMLFGVTLILLAIIHNKTTENEGTSLNSIIYVS